MIKRLKEYKIAGFEVVISIRRNMRNFEGNVGKIYVVTLPAIIQWLNTFGLDGMFQDVKD